jgi:hypothetical protein
LLKNARKVVFNERTRIKFLIQLNEQLIAKNSKLLIQFYFKILKILQLIAILINFFENIHFILNKQIISAFKFVEINIFLKKIQALVFGEVFVKIIL